MADGATRIPEFLTLISKINVKNVNYTQAQTWRGLKESIDELDNSSKKELILEKKEALQKLEKSLGKRTLKTLNRLEQACVNELVYLLREHTINTVAKTDIPLYRQAITERFGELHAALCFFRLNKTERRKMNSDYSKQVKARAGERSLYHVNEYIKTAKKLLDSDSYIDIAMGLCALTGRRPSEILMTASFEETTDRSIQFEFKGKEVEIEFDEAVIFSGQMKLKDSDDGNDNYLIPTLCNADLVRKALTKLRKLKDFSGKTAKQINNTCGKTQNQAVKREFFDFFEGDVKPYDLRHAYALICADRYCDNSNQWGKLYASILGHRDSDVETMNSYMTLKLA